ncbi:hypothetical protein HISP_07390 [Haloarcula hispanica N601]|uniref:Uncharacterized protein n=1 Tax=Haloarcula hispanica N601 TaxID=1417673 RepID=V5TR46_HALHI|nr:hypothetical protein HISP_07390 [Haloarcula hispanica N601]
MVMHTVSPVIKLRLSEATGEAAGLSASSTPLKGWAFALLPL